MGSGKSAIKIGDKNKTAKRQLIIEYLTDHPDAKSAEIAADIDLKPSRVREYLLELIKENIVITSGANRNRTYRLKSLAVNGLNTHNSAAAISQLDNRYQLSIVRLITGIRTEIMKAVGTEPVVVRMNRYKSSFS